MSWHPSLWRDFPVALEPSYEEDWSVVTEKLKKKEPLLSLEQIQFFSDSVQNIKNEHGFVLQIGDCAETFEAGTYENTLKTLRFFEKILTRLKQKTPALLVGRIAGQLAKPRSIMMEMLEGKYQPTYQGDLINSMSHRKIDPSRMLEGYAFSKKILTWIQDYAMDSFFISHDAYLLPYEEGLTRFLDGKWYDSSAHMLWLGDRTRRDAHVIFATGTENTWGIKVGPSSNLNEISTLIDRFSKPVFLIMRLGVKHVQEQLPTFLEALQDKNVFWMCDPMHGNTIKDQTLGKGRLVQDIQNETEIFFDLCFKKNIIPLGLHLESTVHDVYECLDEEKKDINYQSACDPRLNPCQTEKIISLAHEWFLYTLSKKG